MVDDEPRDSRVHNVLSQVTLCDVRRSHSLTTFDSRMAVL